MSTREERSNGFSAQGVTPPAENLRRILIDGDIEAVLDCAQSMASELIARNAATDDVRVLLGAIQGLEVSWPTDPSEAKRELRRLRAWAAHLSRTVVGEAREQEEHPLEELTSALGRGIDILLEQSDGAASASETRLVRSSRREAFTRLVSLFEAIMAYYSYGDAAL
ncbi:MAG: type III-A CRISPR-associated protein Csm2 [Chloroflexota bacterium]|nr:type III-A CRISPR-associated protein Csm2 [Chloroflexota bacterium]